MWLKLTVVFCCLIFFVFDVAAAELDSDYECFQNALNQMNNDSCPLITSEINPNEEIHVNLTIACQKEQYINQGCNESEWVRVCTKKVANFDTSFSNTIINNIIENIPSMNPLKKSAYMYKYCNEGINDPDFECLSNSEIPCPETVVYRNQAMPKDYDHKEYYRLEMDCMKRGYLEAKCNEKEWVRVCNKGIDALNVHKNGGQNVIDYYRKLCYNNAKEENSCYQEIMKKMNTTSSCTETDDHPSNETNKNDENTRRQRPCYKKQFAEAMVLMSELFKCLSKQN